MQSINFQQLIAKLNQFWSTKGCIIGQPYGLEVGAGTANPLTFFRVLGPEPFNVAYVEPSRRPDDGRFGENPNRLQHYFQYQVILKPIPAFNQEMFIELLDSLGISPLEHDIRFVEDNWKSPAIGAWGLGWEVWVDGMEIAQYTYFQQVGGIKLEVPALEITFGLERIAMYIQGVDDYRDIRWNESVTYGDIFERHEYWQSKFNYEDSNVAKLTSLYATYFGMTKDLIGKKNYWAAYDTLLKMSHVFNLLDSRGAVSLTDRIEKFKTMGGLVKEISEMYLAEREKLGFPLLNSAKPIEVKLPEKSIAGVSVDSISRKNQPSSDEYLLEIGFEELPADFVTEWQRNLDKFDAKAWFSTNNMNVADCKLLLTPRRLVFRAKGLKDEISYVEEVKGPIKKICFSEDGSPSQVLQGFVKKHGGRVEDVVFKSVDESGKEFAFITKEIRKSLSDLIQQLVSDLFAKMPEFKGMRWCKEDFSFVRPVRWVISLLGDVSIGINIFDVTSSNFTLTPRYKQPSKISIFSVEEYDRFLSDTGLLLDWHDRRSAIAGAVKENNQLIASSQISHYTEVNASLTEAVAVRWLELDSKYNVLPKELIIKTLEKNQLYLLKYSSNPLRFYYGVVANTDADKERADTIFNGNRKVVNARLEDALFYFEKDKSVKLKDLRTKLKDIPFHIKLGSYFDKVTRIERITEFLLSDLLQESMSPELSEALQLIYNDRVSALVVEYPSLQGIIGYYYALRDGYSESTAVVLKSLVSNAYGKMSHDAVLLFIADRVDTIMSLAAVGEIPTGSSDPYEIRKLVFELIDIIKSRGLNIDLEKLLKFAFDLIKSEDSNTENYGKMVTFIRNRLYRQLKKMSSDDRLARSLAYRKILNIEAIFSDFEKFRVALEDVDIRDRVFDAIKRVNNILGKAETVVGVGAGVKNVDISVLETASEKELYNLVVTKESTTDRVDWFLTLTDVLDRFFKETVVNTDNERLRNARLALLSQVQTKIQSVINVA